MSEAYYVILIPTEGNPKIVPVSGEQPDHTELQALVGGYFEMTLVDPYDNNEIYRPDKLLMTINEEGKLLDLPYNPIADYLHRSPFDAIVGPAVLHPLRRYQTEEGFYESNGAAWTRTQVDQVMNGLCEYLGIKKEDTCPINPSSENTSTSATTTPASATSCV